MCHTWADLPRVARHHAWLFTPSQSGRPRRQAGRPTRMPSKKRKQADGGVAAGTSPATAIEVHEDWDLERRSVPADAVLGKNASTVKMPGDKLFVQQLNRGGFPGEPVCDACQDIGQLDVPYAKRKRFTVYPKFALKEDYVRNEKEDPKALLEAKRKNASRNALVQARSYLRAGDFVFKSVQVQAR
jgi:hypothetical protein